MTTIDSNKRIQKVRTEEEIRKALQNCIHHKVTMCVPPQIDDDDIVLYDVFRELMDLREELHRIKRLNAINERHRKLLSDERNVLLRQVWEADMNWDIKTLQESGHPVVLRENSYQFEG